jgi:uncharacterized protein
MLPAPFLRFVELFNAGSYWESHEVLEGPWREGRSEFYHGLILYASAFVHALRGNPRGVDAQLAKAERALAPFQPHYLGVDVAAVLASAAHCRALAGAGRTDARPPALRLAPELLRGTEPELAASS